MASRASPNVPREIPDGPASPEITQKNAKKPRQFRQAAVDVDPGDVIVSAQGGARMSSTDQREQGPTPPVEWLSTAAAAERAGMSRWYIRDRIEAGVLPARAWVSGARVIYRIDARDLDSLIARTSGEPLDARFGAASRRAGDVD